MGWGSALLGYNEPRVREAIVAATADFAPVVPLAHPLEIEVSHYRRFPHTLQILRQLNAGAGSDAPERRLVIRYVSDDPRKGAIGLIAR